MQNYDSRAVVGLFAAGVKSAVLAQEKIQQALVLSIAGLVSNDDATQAAALRDLNKAIESLAFKSPANAVSAARWLTTNSTIGFNKKAIQFYMVDDACQLTEWHDLTIKYWQPTVKTATAPNDVDPAALVRGMLKAMTATVGKDAKRKAAVSRAKMAACIKLAEQFERDIAAALAGPAKAEPTAQVVDELAVKRDAA